MKKTKSKILLFAFLILCASCVKNDNNAPTVLDIHCLDGYGDPTPGVAVTVYDNSTDWANETNPVYSETTDANGNVSLAGLRGQQYYFWCEDTYNCLLNWGSQTTNGSLATHRTNSLDVVLTGYGTLKVTNTDPGQNPYEIDVNGQVWIHHLGYGESAPEILPVGNQLVEAIQLNGPGDSKQTVSILQCTTTRIDIP